MTKTINLTTNKMTTQDDKQIEQKTIINIEIVSNNEIEYYLNDGWEIIDTKINEVAFNISSADRFYEDYGITPAEILYPNPLIYFIIKKSFSYKLSQKERNEIYKKARDDDRDNYNNFLKRNEIIPTEDKTIYAKKNK
jgi:hypothetical protein